MPDDALVAFFCNGKLVGKKMAFQCIRAASTSCSMATPAFQSTCECLVLDFPCIPFAGKEAMLLNQISGPLTTLSVLWVLRCLWTKMTGLVYLHHCPFLPTHRPSLVTVYFSYCSKSRIFSAKSGDRCLLLWWRPPGPWTSIFACPDCCDVGCIPAGQTSVPPHRRGITIGVTPAYPRLAAAL